MSALRKYWNRKEGASPEASSSPTPQRARPKPAGLVLRIQRVAPGEQVLAVRDVRAVVYELDRVGRFLERLVSEDHSQALDALLKSRTFKEGFATTAARQQEIEAVILWALADRGADTTYRPLTVPGLDPAAVTAALCRLWRDGCIDAAATIPKLVQVTPGGLTTKGVLRLRKLGRKPARRTGDHKKAALLAERD